MKRLLNSINIQCFCGVFLAVFLMAGCSTGQQTIYTYSPPTSVDGRACVDECQQSRTICDSQCTAASPQCQAYEQQKAQRHYNAYVEKQQQRGQPISRHVDSFYHPERCEHSGCGCEENYKVCYQLCGTRTEIHDSQLTDQ